MLRRDGNEKEVAKNIHTLKFLTSYIEDKDYLISLLNEAIDGILQYKDDVTNMFYQIVDKKSVSYLVPKKLKENIFCFSRTLKGALSKSTLILFLVSFLTFTVSIIAPP